MYRYYTKKCDGYIKEGVEDKINVMEYSFDSIDEFINYLDNAPVNTKVWNESQLRSTRNNYSIYKTHSLQEAKTFCKNGYYEDFDKIAELEMILKKYIKKSSKKRKNPIEFYYDVSFSFDAPICKIFNYGVITLCIIDILENLGFNVGLTIFSMLDFADQVHYAKFNLKRNDEKLNIQKLFFTLCNPSFFRRLVIRLCEVAPDIYPYWPYNWYKSNYFTIREITETHPQDILIDFLRNLKIKKKFVILNIGELRI